MISFLRKIIHYLPTVLLSYLLAMAVWISAVSASDPTIERTYTRTVNIELIGQDPAQVVVSPPPGAMNIKLSAPSSIWEQLATEPQAVRALVDLSNLETGKHTLPVKIQISLRPVKLVSYTPRTIDVELDDLISKTLPINMVVNGEPAIGFQLGARVLSDTETTISGPAQLINRVDKIRARLEINNTRESIERDLDLQAIDVNELVVNNVSMSPNVVKVSQAISQRGGYRNVVIKAVLQGQVASGYRVTNISVFPPAVTVFSTDPTIIEQLPGYIETTPLDLNGVNSDVNVKLSLNLPAGVSVVEETAVNVQVGVATIEGSITLDNMPLTINGVKPGFEAVISPDVVDVILSGPLPVLDSLQKSDVQVYIDLAQEGVGTYQRDVQVVVGLPDIQVEAILPSTLEVVIRIAPKRTATPVFIPTLPLETPTPQP